MKKHPKIALALFSLLLLTLLIYRFPAKEMSRIDFIVYINGMIWGLIVFFGYSVIKYVSEYIPEHIPEEVTSPKSSKNPQETLSTSLSKKLLDAVSWAIASMLTLVILLPMWACAKLAIDIIAGILLGIFYLTQLVSFAFPLSTLAFIFLSLYLLISRGNNHAKEILD